METMKSVRSVLAQSRILAISSVLFASLALSSGCFAQAPALELAISQGNSLEINAAPLEKFVGYYQLPNKVAFIQFELKANTLFAKQLWDNKAYELVQIDDTNFASKEEGHKVEFIKDNSGQFSSAKILGRILTVKVAFEPQTIKLLPAATLKKLEGTYSLKSDGSFRIDIRSSASGLTLKQLWDNKEITFTPRSETFFLNEDGAFPLTFVLRDGHPTQVTCFEDDVWLKAK